MNKDLLRARAATIATAFHQVGVGVPGGGGGEVEVRGVCSDSGGVVDTAVKRTERFGGIDFQDRRLRLENTSQGSSEGLYPFLK